MTKHILLTAVLTLSMGALTSAQTYYIIDPALLTTQQSDPTITRTDSTTTTTEPTDPSSNKPATTEPTTPPRETGETDPTTEPEPENPFGIAPIPEQDPTIPTPENPRLPIDPRTPTTPQDPANPISCPENTVVRLCPSNDQAVQTYVKLLTKEQLKNAGILFGGGFLGLGLWALTYTLMSNTTLKRDELQAKRLFTYQQRNNPQREELLKSIQTMQNE